MPGSWPRTTAGCRRPRCGALHLVEADNAEALALGIVDALSLDRVSAPARAAAAQCFTVGQSVDALLAVLRAPHPITPFRLVQELEELVSIALAPCLDPHPQQGQ